MVYICSVRVLIFECLPLETFGKQSNDAAKMQE